jgi:DNA polymerase-3 subunit alpha
VKKNMNKEDFCHLHLHSEYSQLDGFGSASKYAEKAVANGQKFLACTDHGNIDGLIKFQKACDQAGIKPILGCEGYLVNEWKKKAVRGHVSLWIKNNTGFRNLCKMLTIANLEGYHYKPRIDFKTLMKYRRGLVIGTACVMSFINVEGGIDFFHKLHKRMKDDLYLELMPHDIKIQAEHNKRILKLAKETRVKVIVTNDCHYIDRSDWKVHDVLLAIQRKVTWNDPKRWSFGFHGLHLRKTNEMIRAMKAVGIYNEKFLINTLEIAEKCSDYRIPKRDIKLPHVPGIDPDKENKTLWQLCVDGYRDRFHRSVSHNTEYKERLKMEYDLIVEKKFTRYFLIVWELCSWCKKQGILIGPGRGSVGGSLMAYLLGITSVDPIKHNLIFDRFINKDRIDYPDIDIDFEDTKRHLIKEHLEELYGEGNISGVSSFNRMKAKAAVKDVARVFEVSEGEANSFTKMIDDKFPGTEAEKIQNAIDEYQVCQEFAENYPRIIKYAKQLAGQVKNYGKHAAAIIVSMQEIGKSGRCVLIDTKKGRNINWEKDDTEFVGLMKLDSLGLKLLSILSHAIELIKQNHNKNIELDLLELENPQVLKEISEGNTVGAFQINTWAMTNLIKDMGVEEFNHIAHAISLVRPGPTESGMTDNYIKRKRGEHWDKMHHVYEELTSDTYGLLVFQEQIMAVINKVAGLPYETADKIRKIIGKKRDAKEFKKFERKFMRGCRKTKIFSEREATQFWAGLQKWSRYGFNRAHAVEYAILGMWCMWIKHYYPTEFICASLTFGAKEKKREIVEEAYRLGLVMRLPKIGISHATKWVARDNMLFIPFKEVGGLGPVKAVEAARGGGIKDDDPGITKFFNKENKMKVKKIKRHPGDLGKKLDAIKAYDPTDTTITEEMREYFDFRVVSNPKENYKNLYNLFGGSIRLDRLDNTLNGETKELKKLGGNAVKRRRFKKYGYYELQSCTACKLRNECHRPVMPSPGKYNIVLAGEAPGPKEDQFGWGFYEEAPAGGLLWGDINRKGYERSLFHVTNINKCYPSKSRKPNSKQIQECTSRYLNDELKQIKPVLILAFGNTSLQFFEGIKSGITGMSGRTTWNEKYGCWIAWCLHPAATFHNPDNKSFYIAGMKNFFRLMRILAPGLSDKTVYNRKRRR